MDWTAGKPAARWCWVDGAGPMVLDRWCWTDGAGPMVLGLASLCSTVLADVAPEGILERRPQENILTACGQRVGLMTRAAVNPIDSDAAHSPPPFPTVLALEPRFPGRVL